MTTPPPDYDELARLLASSPLVPSPAEVQGLYVGLVLGPSAGEAAVAALIAEVLPAAAPASAGIASAEPAAAEPESADPAPAHGLAVHPSHSPADHPLAVAALRALAHHTAEGLADPGLGFDLLLPPESRSLRERALAVVDWSRGLLYGLALGGVGPGALSVEGREALADLLTITRMDPDDLDEGPANEAALVELVEFIRVAVMLLLDERPTQH